MRREQAPALRGALRIDAVRPNGFDLSALDKLGHLPLSKGRQGCGASDTRKGRPYEGVHPWRWEQAPALQGGAVRWGARCGRGCGMSIIAENLNILSKKSASFHAI